MPDEEPTQITPKAEQQIKALQLTIPQVTRTASVLNAAQINAIFNSTPRKYKYSRPGKGGGNWTYVRAGYVRQRLDSIFGFNWDFEVSTSVAEALDVAVKTGTVVVKGRLTGRIMRLEHDPKTKELVGGELITTITKEDFGRQEVKFKKNSKDLLDFGNDLKGAATDCFKRCAARYGIAADVYDPLEFMAIEIVGEEAPAKSKKLSKQIDAAKAVIDEQAREVGGQNGQ